MAVALNYTPIDDLVKKHASSAPVSTTKDDLLHKLVDASLDTPQETTQQPAPAPEPATISVSPEKGPITVKAPEQSADTTVTESVQAGETAEDVESGLREFSPLQEAVEHEIQDDEVKEFVEATPENVSVPADLHQQGVQATQATNFPSYQAVKLPITDEQVVEGLKQPQTSSFRWLAEFAMYLLKKAHITLKTVHGHVERVVKR